MRLASIGISGGHGHPRVWSPICCARRTSRCTAPKPPGAAATRVFEARMNQLPAEHLQLESDLHRAIERNELRVHYQPIFALKRRRRSPASKRSYAGSIPKTA